MNFDTERLAVRDWMPLLEHPAEAARLADALRPILTPPVMRHLPEHVKLPQTAPDIPQWMADRAEQGAVATITDTEARALVGLLFLSHPEQTPGGSERYLGYLFAQDAWGKGYATEAVTGLLAHLDGQGVLRLLAGVTPENTASARVLVKAGFAHDPVLSQPDLNRYARAIT